MCADSNAIGKMFVETVTDCMERERDLITNPTWERYTVLSHSITQLNIRDRRRIFQIARSVQGDWSNIFLPEYGFTLCEFSVWYTLGDRRRTGCNRDV